MIGKALELEAKRAQPDRTGGHEAFGHGLECLAVGPRERDRGVTRDARGEAMAFEDREFREALLDPLVHVAKPFLEPQHFLAYDGEPKVSRLDRACVNGSDGDLVDAFALHTHEVIHRALVTKPRPLVRIGRLHSVEVERRALHSRCRRKQGFHAGIARMRVFGRHRKLREEQTCLDPIGRIDRCARRVVRTASSPQRDEAAAGRGHILGSIGPFLPSDN